MTSTTYEQREEWPASVAMHPEDAIKMTQKSSIKFFGKVVNSKTQIAEIFAWSLQESRMDFDGLTVTILVKNLPYVLRVVKRYASLILFANFVQGNPYRMGAYRMSMPK